MTGAAAFGLPGAALIAVAAVLALAALFLGIALGMAIGRLKAERAFSSRLEAERLDAVKRSRAVLGGQFSEQLSPYLPGFPANPTEVRFIGKPVDFIAFSGSSRGEVEEVLFVEVKTGGARLSPVERSLRDAIGGGRVRFVEYRVPGGERP